MNVTPDRPQPWPVDPVDLGAVRIAGAGAMFDLDEFLAWTHTTAFLVAVDGVIVAERYFKGRSAAEPLLGYSATKSALALLVGAAGLADLDAPVVTYVPELAGSGYATATVRHVLSMTSGVDWVEDHRDPTSPAARLGSGAVRDQLRRIPGGRPPGDAFTYCTADSLVLDWVRERATGLDFATHLASVWTVIGAEHPATVGVDTQGVARAGGGLAATARDWAKLGALQISGGGPVSPAWTAQSSRPGRPFLHPGRLPSTITGQAGFGYQWWPLDVSGNRVMADGMRGQLVYVDRARRAVVVKMSDWPYANPWADRQFRDLSYLALPVIAEAALAATTAPAPVWDEGRAIEAPLRLHETVVRPDWVDYNGHLTESCYLLVFGDNSDAFFRFFGVDDAYRAAGHSLYTVETHLTNRREVAEGEPLHLTLQLLDLDEKRVRILHAMYHGVTGDLLATADQLLLHVDLAGGRAAPIPAHLRRRLNAIRAAHAGLPEAAPVCRSIQLRRTVRPAGGR